MAGPLDREPHGEASRTTPPQDSSGDIRQALKTWKEHHPTLGIFENANARFPFGRAFAVVVERRSSLSLGGIVVDLERGVAIRTPTANLIKI
jgi:hypothetical protein